MKICALLESTPQHLNLVDMDAAEAVTSIQEHMAELAGKYKDKQKDTTTRGAAPDSSKFRATVSGMIKLEHNVHIHGGQYVCQEAAIVSNRSFSRHEPLVQLST